ncbi:MAG: cyclic nucleotide-binding domain-containing protein [Pseudomonadota bacterium]|nr:cyclic nucleotide-binding domain-containing protein [Pseudomonadota bacterium]
MMQITPEAFSQHFASLRLPADGAAALLPVLQPRQVAAGDHLLTRGQFNDTLYLLWSGRLSMTVASPRTRLTLGSVEPGGWVGEFGFLDPGTASADVVAVEDATVLALSQDGLETLYRQSVNTACLLLQGLSLELARRLRATSTHYLEKSGEGEYALRLPAAAEEPPGLFERLRSLLGLGGDAP